MARKAKYQTNLKREVKSGKKSITEVMTTSAVGTQVHEIQDPSERLVAIIGASMFNEPKYYPTDPQSQTREYEYDTEDFDQHAQLIINTAQQIAESDSPRDLLAIAHWARTEMKIRTTPQVLLSVAANCPATKEYVREYCPKVIQRADELKQAFIANRSLYGSQKSLPNSLKRGLADAFKKFGERDFLKYEGQNRPHFADVLKMVDRARNYPLPKPLDHYLKTGEVTDEKATPIVAARKKLTQLKSFGPRAAKYAKESGANWEVLLSQFGNTKDVWEHLIENNQLPYMATLRNLRNIIEADVDMKYINQVCKKLVEGAVHSKQLPFRFLAARAALAYENPSRMSWGYYDSMRPKKLNAKGQKLLEAIDQAVEAVVEAMDPLPGKSLIAVDNSGSMSSPVSQKSQMTLNQAAATLAAIIMKRSEQGSVAGGFGNTWKPLGNKQGPALEVAERIQRLDVGHSTNAEAVIEWAINGNHEFDRIIILSDMQTYGGGGGGYYGRSHESVKDLIKKYRKMISKGCKLHCIDLAGHGQALTEQADTKTNLVAGFSEKMINIIREFEGLNVEVDEETGEETQVFTIEYIRNNY